MSRARTAIARRAGSLGSVAALLAGATVLLVVSSARPPRAAAAGSSDKAKRERLTRVLEALRKPKTIQADLHQVKKMHAFKTPQRARGRVTIVPPRHVRWVYDSPYQMVLVYDGKRASLSYPKLGRKQLIDLDRRPTMKSIFETMLFFLDASPNAIDKHFRVALLAARDPRTDGKSAKGADPRGRGGRATAVRLRLTPKSAKARALVKAVEASVDVARGVLTELTLFEPDGDNTRLRFENIRIDRPVDRAKLKP